jgi:L-aspartate oxidase
MEFIQFHPTAFAKSASPKFLLSEALRGEGAILINSKEERFINELSPRDIVARAIYKELENGQVYLKFPKQNLSLKNRFPKIYSKLKKYGLDLSKDKIPVVPAAHYLCGGIKTDLNGRTNLKNLYAFGETTCTGVHGANRLASNSLLEAVVFSNQVVKDVKPSKRLKIFEVHHEHLTNSPELIKKAKNLRKQIQETMWKNCGILRTQKKLSLGLKKLLKIQTKLKLLNGKIINRDLIETKNLLETSLLIIRTAQKRKTSLGCHFME